MGGATSIASELGKRGAKTKGYIAEKIGSAPLQTRSAQFLADCRTTGLTYGSAAMD
jgi:hypothetical protein